MPGKGRVFPRMCSVWRWPVWRRIPTIARSWSQLVAELATFYTETTGESPVLEISGPELEARELMDKGYSLTALGRYEEALESYDRAIDLQPDYAWRGRGKGEPCAC